jgi:hypothetical protein
VTIASAPSLSRLLRLASLLRVTSRSAFNEAHLRDRSAFGSSKPPETACHPLEAKRGRCASCLKRNLTVIAPMQCERLDWTGLNPRIAEGQRPDKLKIKLK